MKLGIAGSALLLVMVAGLIAVAASRGSAHDQVAVKAQAVASPTLAAPTFGVLKSVSNEALAQSSIAVQAASQADLAAAAISAEQAEAVSSVHFPNVAHKEVALVHFSDELTQPRFQCLCWVVSGEASAPPYVGGGPSRSGGTTTPLVVSERFHLDVVDAVTGKYIYSVEGGRVR